MTYNTVVVLVGAGLLGVLCGVIGCFAVLRRRALVGDVMAHAAYPGLPLAFLLGAGRQLPWLLVGALTTGLLGLAALAYLRRRTRTREDAAMAIVLAVTFGAGVALSRHVQNVSMTGTHAGLDAFIYGKTAGLVLADIYLTAGVASFAIGGIALAFKEFRLVCFDASFAQSLGYRVGGIDFAILTLLALAVVVGLPMVGVVMVAALTIIPPVTARFWTDSLAAMLVLAGLFAAVSTTVGVLLSARIAELPSGPVVIMAAFGFFLFSAAFAPRRGLWAKAARRRRLRQTVLREGWQP